ncbi:hypothetical protein FA13DRAFT_1797261 [Coprinellus micaceus]|uniref:Uncharacterized protein n=1 Tax=Coprinellus micaceus TaxID=71717 RepID=A0A4Y7SRA0_COPMI|nr:hypothetical protein FA13DRAFT_1797261 [Coprinellus micaceus]
MGPNNSGQHSRHGFWPHPHIHLPTVQQTRYYEQGFWEPPQSPPPTNQHISIPLSVGNRVSGYDSHPNQLQPQDSYLRPASQYLHPHDFSPVQPSPRRWDYSTATQLPGHSDACYRTQDRNPGASGRSQQHPQIQRTYQPAAPNVYGEHPSPQKYTQARLSISDASERPNPKKRTWPHPLSIYVSLQRSASRTPPNTVGNAGSHSDRTTISKPSDSKTKPIVRTFSERKLLTLYARIRRQTYP